MANAFAESVSNAFNQVNIYTTTIWEILLYLGKEDTFLYSDLVSHRWPKKEHNVTSVGLVVSKVDYLLQMLQEFWSWLEQ